MLRIGEFSKLTGVSIHMLRNYDKLELLVPSQVDMQTGYRYYDEAQVLKANQIQVLKRLGFGLQEIKEIQKERTSNAELKLFLQEKIDEKIHERESIDEQIKAIKQVINEMEEESRGFSLEVNVKTLPSKNVVGYRGIIHQFNQEGSLWEILIKECLRQNVRLADVEYSFAITHHVDFEKSIMDVEVQFVVEKFYKGLEVIKCENIPECQVAAIAFKGQYIQIGEINTYIKEWIKENSYQIIGKPFSTYYRSPGNEQNPEQFITELCFPITKEK